MTWQRRLLFDPNSSFFLRWSGFSSDPRRRTGLEGEKFVTIMMGIGSLDHLTMELMQAMYYSQLRVTEEDMED